ncbi:hypothetical protein [Paraflavitalea speifideaquila]|uniref:hypothetical protein n=1 Tax=Paraflavitalea speifideaquila TaxID=3076558 RepID=UPI0028EE0A71|nr:hypothetical protein [Paraflavitalea speifideiaquila]
MFQLMKTCFLFLLSLYTLQAVTQTKSPADYGFRHLQMLYKSDTVQLLIKSKREKNKSPNPCSCFARAASLFP